METIEPICRTDMPHLVSAPVQAARSARHPVLVPVVISHPKLWKWKGLRRCLSQREGFVLVEGDDSPNRLLAQCQHLAPCVVITDQTSLERLSAAEFTTLADLGRSIQLLVSMPVRDELAIQNLVRLGCMGVVIEGASGTTLKKAVKALARGEMWIERRILTRVLQQMLFASRSPRLTSREKDVLKLIARGYKNRSIAEELAISHETVRWHIRSLHSKLGIEDRLGTALYAQQYLDDDRASELACADWMG
jgi:DNA-binding NarL/FixJ family response regulator